MVLTKGVGGSASVDEPVVGEEERPLGGQRRRLAAISDQVGAEGRTRYALARDQHRRYDAGLHNHKFVMEEGKERVHILWRKS